LQNEATLGNERGFFRGQASLQAVYKCLRTLTMSLHCGLRLIHKLDWLELTASDTAAPGKRMSVNRRFVLAVATLLVLSAATLIAQHGGHGGGGGGRRGSPGATADTSDAGLVDFNRALAVQATSDQVSHFPGLTKNTAAARNLAKDFSGMGGKPGSATEFYRKTAALKEAVEEAQGSNQDFVKSFTKSQKAGLKELSKKLEKADSEVTKQSKDLEKQVGGAKAVSEGMAGTADKLEKALEEFQSQQIELGKEMGITPAS
jgi:hypothetical protein